MKHMGQTWNLERLGWARSNSKMWYRSNKTFQSPMIDNRILAMQQWLQQARLLLWSTWCAAKSSGLVAQLWANLPQEISQACVNLLFREQGFDTIPWGAMLNGLQCYVASKFTNGGISLKYTVVIGPSALMSTVWACNCTNKTVHYTKIYRYLQKNTLLISRREST